jgi:hypothetical protein
MFSGVIDQLRNKSETAADEWWLSEHDEPCATGTEINYFFPVANWATDF